MTMTDDQLWQMVMQEAQLASDEEPLLADFFSRSILDQPDLDAALSFNLAAQLDGGAIAKDKIAAVITQALQADASIGQAIRED